MSRLLVEPETISMDLTAHKVNPITCGKCGTQIDTADAEALSVVACPKCGASMNVPAEIGNILLFKRLGAGSSGTVYHGLDQDLRRNIAVKILHGDDQSVADPDAVLAEARAMAAVNHPNVCKIHTIGKLGERHYIAMELLTTGNVQRMIDKRGKLSERRSIRIAIDTAKGLRAAYVAGLRHQDVKPENILLDENANAKLLDFGFARFGRKTQTQTIIGTPAYVAPEIIEQEEADFRADIYSLGCTLYHMLAGDTPFGGASASGAYAAHLREDPKYLRDVNPKLHTETADAVAVMLRREPEERPGSYDELIEMLESAQAAVDAGKQDPNEPVIDQALRDAVSEAQQAASPRRSAPTPKPRRSDSSRKSASRSGSAKRSGRTHPPAKPDPLGGLSSAARKSTRSRPASTSRKTSPKRAKKKDNGALVMVIILAIVALVLVGLSILMFSLIMSEQEDDEDARRPIDRPAVVSVSDTDHRVI